MKQESGIEKDITSTAQASGPARAARPATAAGSTPQDTVHEAYSFACMRCGHGWEQEYEIRHLEYADGKPLIVYYADGERVPSPLTDPTCRFCDGHVVRIMRSGRVSAAEAALLHH
ncbi:hypothetical protein ACF1DY_26750 [Streptomyces albus]|uniref:hypothetical protein n=1 Tax=Streptomyces albus TaxID=1888 RepID=UPI0036FFAC67